MSAFTNPPYAEGTAVVRLKVDAPKRRGGKRHGYLTLTDETVRSIRRAAALGLTQRAIAEQLGISRTAISNVITGRSYGDVE